MSQVDFPPGSETKSNMDYTNPGTQAQEGPFLFGICHGQFQNYLKVLMFDKAWCTNMTCVLGGTTENEKEIYKYCANQTLQRHPYNTTLGQHLIPHILLGQHSLYLHTIGNPLTIKPTRLNSMSLSKSKVKLLHHYLSTPLPLFTIYPP